MCILWFIFLSYLHRKGIEITEIAFLMIGLFYIGDCILIKGKGEKK